MAINKNKITLMRDKIKNYPKLSLVILAYVAFIALGMPDGLLGVAWPSIRSDFSLPIEAVGVLIPVSVTGYLISSFISGPIVSRWGIGKILAASCGLTGAALLGYTLVPSWWMMVSLGIFSGLGAGAIDAGLNNYGASHFSEGLMQWLHASYGVGITLGPIIMTVAISSMNSWRIGYRIVGGFQILLALCFLFTVSMWSKNGERPNEKDTSDSSEKIVSIWKTLLKPKVWLSAMLFFLYVGAEVSLGIWIYSLLTESRGIEPSLAGLVAGSYWATFTIGRVIAGLFAKRAGNDRLIQASIGAALLGTILLWLNLTNLFNLLAVALIGLAIAPIFPALMSSTSGRVEKEHTSNTVGLQITATGLGTAVFPGLFGVLSSSFSLEVVPACLFLLFLGLFVLFQFSKAVRKNKLDQNSSVNL